MLIIAYLQFINKQIYELQNDIVKCTNVREMIQARCKLVISGSASYQMTRVFKVTIMCL